MSIDTEMGDSPSITPNGTANGAKFPSTTSDVCVVGAGPAGLMLATNLARFGVQVQIIDERETQTEMGRADGLQPKTIETLRIMRLADPLVRRGVRVYDICLWKSVQGSGQLKRMGREIHYPPEIVDLMDPYILLCHQGMVESQFIEDMRLRGVEVSRNHKFDSCQISDGKVIEVEATHGKTAEKVKLETQYLIGCDGAHSKVRKFIPGAEANGAKPSESLWGVLDGELTTEFPDIWSKTVVHSEEHGSVLIIPRERNLTRFYIELKAGSGASASDQDYVMGQARLILAPYSLEWKTVEWFGRYQIGQRVAPQFVDPNGRIFIAGDASHTHSPKAAQGMNTSMHDSLNLAWKLNLAVRGLAKPSLLASYEEERRKIAHDLINFDLEHANQIASGDAEALANNFKSNVRFISGFGVEYDANAVNPAAKSPEGQVKPGCLVPPAKVTRYIDANPVDLQIDIPMLGQFRTFIFVPDVLQGKKFLSSFCESISQPTSPVGKLSQAAQVSYGLKPRPSVPDDAFSMPGRYTSFNNLFTLALITSTDKEKIEIEDLPSALQQSRWTFYLDDVPTMDTRGEPCTKKWLGSLASSEAAIVQVRPDGYVGAVGRWSLADAEAGKTAAAWLGEYYDGFLITA